MTPTLRSLTPYRVYNDLVGWDDDLRNVMGIYGFRLATPLCGVVNGVLTPLVLPIAKEDLRI